MVTRDPLCCSHAFARKDSSQQGIYKQLRPIVQGYGVGLCPPATCELLSKAKISSGSESVIEWNSWPLVVQRCDQNAGMASDAGV